MKKLALKRETVRVLVAELARVRGGFITETTYTCDTWTNPDPSGNTCICGPTTTAITVDRNCTFVCPSAFPWAC